MAEYRITLTGNMNGAVTGGAVVKATNAAVAVKRAMTGWWPDPRAKKGEVSTTGARNTSMWKNETLTITVTREA
jgi:hypothetical protein